MKADVKPDSREKEALEWAINHFRDSRNLKPFDHKAEYLWFFWECSRKQGADGRERFDNYIISLITPTGPLNKSLFADCDPRSNARLLCQLAGKLMSRGHSLPKPLQDFIIDFLDDPNLENFPSASGRKPSHTWVRNITITMAIRHIVETWGFRATRGQRKNPAKGLSAASIVKEALEKSGLHLTEGAVIKIWNRLA
jgi:hypothetical protein